MTFKVFASRYFGHVLVEVAVGDITEQRDIDAVVNPTTSLFRFGGGVGKAILAKVDRQGLVEACKQLPPLDKCGVALTPSFGLPSGRIIHCRGPRHGERGAPDLLHSTYRNVFELAEASGLKSISVPAISAGEMGFHIGDAARIAVDSIKCQSPGCFNLRTIRFVLIDEGTAAVFAKFLTAPPALPNKRIHLKMPYEYSGKELEVIRQGHYGDQDTKWFFYHDAPWLLIYRGGRRSDNCYFILRLPTQTESSGMIEEAWLDGGLLPWEKHEAEKFVQSLLEQTFDLVNCVGHKEEISGIRFWIKNGRIVIERLQDEVRMSPEDATRLGRRLVQLSGELSEMTGS